VKALWSRKLARITTMTWLMWLSITFSYYAFFTWIPSLLVQNGMTITRSFSYSLVIYIAQYRAISRAHGSTKKIGAGDHWRRIWCWEESPRLALRSPAATRAIMASGVLLSFFMNGTYAGVMPTRRSFPTDVRTTGVAWLHR